jgi:hypothetical protein
MGGIIVTEHSIALPNENISGTISDIPADVTGSCNAGRRAVRPCSYVVATAWRYGGPDPFCNAPAVPGSSYCPRHHALCEGTAGEASAVELADNVVFLPPPELAHLAATPLPDALDESEPADALEGFALPRGVTAEEG